MKQGKKGSAWYFGMVLHMGTDLQGLVHSVTEASVTAGDLNQMPDFLQGSERVVF